MTSPPSAAEVDLDDADGLLAADRHGLLRAASMAGAQVRATAAALAEGDLESVRSDAPPRTIVWVAGPGNAEAAGTMLAALLGGSIGTPIVVAADAPPWIGALDVVVLAGDDPAQPALVNTAATAVRRGARIVVVAPYEGPLRDATAGRSVSLPPRMPVPDDFTLARYLAAGLAVLDVVVPGFSVDLATLADDLDAEAVRNSAGRDLFTNPAKVLADRMRDRDVVLAGDSAATVALARHACAVMLRVGHHVMAPVGLSDALVAIGTGWGRPGGGTSSIFHDEELDGPLPQQGRTIVLTTDAERHTVSARLRGFDDVYVVNANDVPDVAAPGGNSEPGSATTPGSARPEQQLALLAVRLEMAAVYRRLVRG
ncbi:TobH protein [Mycolicibacterium gilvum]|uniref:TobH protein n=1 Tax=Mycolicibacterium gilvum TaxID=1804 RepID=A0A378SHX0_9MYCO|nr:TobH protein [Mycolicibacterium gilvum]MCV7057169.1 TobH protein [Mycolicibacterium gilvum]STZ42303.1 TobH protein [Mycolicibacterium gilvum]